MFTVESEQPLLVSQEQEGVRAPCFTGSGLPRLARADLFFFVSLPLVETRQQVEKWQRVGAMSVTMIDFLTFATLHLCTVQCLVRCGALGSPVTVRGNKFTPFERYTPGLCCV